MKPRVLHPRATAVAQSNSGSVRSSTRALMSVPAAHRATESVTEKNVTFATSDGWQIAGSLQIPKIKGKTPGVVLVHGSRHEKDAYGQTLPQMLWDRSFATLRIDIRGRGASSAPLGFHSMAPGQRKGVRLDVEAAIGFLTSQSGVDRRRIAIAAEQDSADATVIACATNRRVATYVLISGRLSRQAKDAITTISAPIFCLVSKEDGRGFKDMTDAYLASGNAHSRLKVFDGIGFGTTMFSAWQFEFPDEQPIEQMIADWLAERMSRKVTKSRSRKK